MAAGVTIPARLGHRMRELMHVAQSAVSQHHALLNPPDHRDHLDGVALPGMFTAASKASI